MICQDAVLAVRYKTSADRSINPRRTTTRKNIRIGGTEFLSPVYVRKLYSASEGT